MANAKMCDRCGKYYTPCPESDLDKVAASIRKAFCIEPSVSKTDVLADVWDLCSDYRDSFVRWFAMKGEDN